MGFRLNLYVSGGTQNSFICKLNSLSYILFITLGRWRSTRKFQDLNYTGNSPLWRSFIEASII